MGPIKESSSYCPQSEPVKRKVYAGSATYGRIQKTLGEHVMLRNSDGDTATDDTGRYLRTDVAVFHSSLFKLFYFINKLCANLILCRSHNIFVYEYYFFFFVTRR